jgi:hypothetical protein
MSKQFRIAVTMTQQTGGESDNNALVEEFSDSLEMHLLKTQVFTECFTKAVNEAVQKLTGMALAGGGKKQ